MPDPVSGVPAPDVKMGRVHFLARVHWAGRLAVLMFSSLLLSWPIALVFPVFLWETHFFMGLIVSSLLLDRWFGLGWGGLLGLSLSLRNLRLIALTSLVLFLFCLLLILVEGLLRSILPGNESASLISGLWQSTASMILRFVDLIPGIDVAASVIPGVHISSVSPLQVLFVACHALGEELLFRGIPLFVLARRFGWSAAVTVVTIAFTAVHFMHFTPGIIATANLMLFGLFTALAVERSGSLWVPITFHVAWNLSHAFSLSLPLGNLLFVMKETQTLPPQFAYAFAGYEWVLGGPGVGPEGGLLMTAFLLGLILLFVPRLEHLRDPVLAARDFRRRLRESRLAAVHGFRS